MTVSPTIHRFRLAQLSVLLFLLCGLTCTAATAAPVAAAEKQASSLCTAEVASLHANIRHYMKTAQFSPWMPQGYADNLVQFKSFIANQSQECANEVATAYAIAVFDQITPFMRISTLETYKPELLALLKEMVARGKLVPLTEDLRKSFAHQSGDQGWSTLLGAYECKESVIYFDPSLSPLDLGSVVAHELDHFLRDKIAYGSSPVHGWERNITDSTPREMIVMDETMAVIMGALTEFRFFADVSEQRDIFNHKNTSLNRGFFNRDWAANNAYPAAYGSFSRVVQEFFTSKYIRFNVPEGQDLHLFSQQGAVYRIWKKNIHAQLKLTGDGVPILGSFSDLYAGFGAPEAKKDLIKIIQIMAKVYFPDESIRAESVAEKILQRLSLNNTAIGIDPMIAALSARSADSDQAFSNLAQTLDGTSIGCMALSRAVGIRPEHEGARPEHEGARPEHEGARPEHEGARPDRVLRPCYPAGKGI